MGWNVEKSVSLSKKSMFATSSMDQSRKYDSGVGWVPGGIASAKIPYTISAEVLAWRSLRKFDSSRL
jgi:hypothetical protein